MDPQKYKVRQIIGEGATCTVYKAIDSGSGTMVAIKSYYSMAEPLINTEIAEKVKKEAELLKKLKEANNEHIIDLIDIIPPNSIVLEYCEYSLISFLNSYELDYKGIKKIMRMILLGLNDIHKLGIIHRDIKLANILVKNDCIKICDFGLSCYIWDNDYTYCGTREYLAPEIRIIGERILERKAGNNSSGRNIYTKSNDLNDKVPNTCDNFNNRNTPIYNNHRIYSIKEKMQTLGVNSDKYKQSNKLGEDQYYTPTHEDIYNKYQSHRMSNLKESNEKHVPDIQPINLYSKFLSVNDSSLKYDQKVDIYAAGFIYKTLLSRKKNVDLNEIFVGRDIKDFIISLTHNDPEKRPTAYDALKSNIFDDLFYAIPNFKILNNFTKQTKYGKFKKFKQINHNLYSDCIEVEFNINNKFYKLTIEQEGSSSGYNIYLNDKLTEKSLISNTFLKYFNLLCKYFENICDKTIVFKEKSGNTIYSITASEVKIIETPLYVVRNTKDTYEVKSISNSFAQCDNNIKIYNFNSLPPNIKRLFEFFNKVKSNDRCMSIDQYSSMSVSLHPDELIKKYGFLPQYGWIIKEGLNFLILTNTGKKFAIKTEERHLIIDDARIQKLEDTDLQDLKMIKRMVSRFI